MQESTRQQILLNKAQGHGVRLVCDLRSGSDSAVIGLGIAEAEPCLELVVELLQGGYILQGTLGNKLVHRLVEPLLLSLALGIARPGVHQPDSEKGACALHPMGAVLRAIVEIETLRSAVFHNSLAKRVLHNSLRHVVVEFAMEDHTGCVVNQARKIGRSGQTVNLQRGTILNVALPEIVSVNPLETLRAVGRIPVDFHHSG